MNPPAGTLNRTNADKNTLQDNNVLQGIFFFTVWNIFFQYSFLVLCRSISQPSSHRPP